MQTLPVMPYLMPFQFQNGSIKRGAHQVTAQELIKFQFQNGSIKRNVSKGGTPWQNFVSIPKWFD